MSNANQNQKAAAPQTGTQDAKATDDAKKLQAVEKTDAKPSGTQSNKDTASKK